MPIRPLLKWCFLLCSLCGFSIETQAQLENPLVAYYYENLKLLPYNESTSLNKALRRYKETFKNIDPAICDTAFIVFEEYMIRTLNEVNFDYRLLSNPNKIKGDKQRRSMIAYQAKLKRQNYIFTENKDVLIVLPDLENIHAQLKPFLTPAMQVFLDKTDLESKEGFSQEDSLLISPQLLAERCLWWEKFIQDYPKFLLKQDAQERYNTYLETLVFGTSKTSLFNTKKNKLRADFKKTYQWLVKSHPLSITGDVVERYLFVLEKNNYTLCDELLFFTWE
ncbi:MAG: hypothetical protein RSC04_05690 [Bacteroidales bacterium]